MAYERDLRPLAAAENHWHMQAAGKAHFRRVEQLDPEKGKVVPDEGGNASTKNVRGSSALNTTDDAEPFWPFSL